MSEQSNVVYLGYLKPWALLDKIIYVWNGIGLHYQDANIFALKSLILCQKISFANILKYKTPMPIL